MPLLYIHGVNVRDEKASLREAISLAEGLARHVIAPLARDGVGRFSEINIDPELPVFPVYWGDVGVKFAWGLRSLPHIGLNDIFGEIEPAKYLVNRQNVPRFGRIREFFTRMWNVPSRVASVAALTLHRDSWNDQVARFTGDVFHYLRQRGNREHPGPIIRRVLDEIDRAATSHPGEPLIVVTHSMGGNIFMDILNHYRPDSRVDLWISAGGQVGMFEEMKLYQESDPTLRYPFKVDPPGDRVKCWLNVYDPADPFSYLAGPVFSAVTADVCYKTGAGGVGAHTSYFRQRSFYETIREKLREVYREA